MSMDINSKDTAFLEITAHKRHNLSTNFVRVTCNMSAEIRKTAFLRQVLQDTRVYIIMVRKKCFIVPNECTIKHLDLLESGKLL